MKNKDLTFLFFGVGSIGQRHLKNIQSLGYNKIFIHDPNVELAKEVSSEYNVEIVNENSLWSKKYDIALITNPNSMHLDLAIVAAEKGCNLFIEKPLATQINSVEKLLKIVKEKNLKTIVGCNMRFHPGPQKVKELIESKIVGDILSAYVDSGSYLPDWRPWQDYKKSYSARKDLGGGVVLDGIHEIDLTCWYFGIPIEVKANVYNTNSIGIECEDVADILFMFQDGFSCMTHVDYIQRFYQRRCRVAGKNGTIWWDVNDKKVTVYNSKTNSFTNYMEPEGYDPNQMYLDEMKHFINCINNNQQPTNNVFEAYEILKVALAVKGELE